MNTLQPPSQSNGPYLLIQTDFDQYQILDIAQKTLLPIHFPKGSGQINLTSSLSPSGTLLLVPLNDHGMVIQSLITGEVTAPFNLTDPPIRFLPNKAAEEALSDFPQISFSKTDLMQSIQKTLDQTKQICRWHQSDRYTLSVQEAETSTHLAREDHQTGLRSQLETHPAMVEAYWIAPDGEAILLRKGYNSDPSAWQNDRYYHLDINRKYATPIPLPEGAVNPSVFWVSADLVGVIHQPKPVGGVNFSLIDTATMKSNLVVQGSFIGVIASGSHLLSLHQYPDACSTNLAFRTLGGEVITTQQLPGQCFLNAVVDDQRFILNCEDESFLIAAESFSISPFGEPVFQLASSPSRTAFIRVARSSETSLLNASLQVENTLTLEGDPLEVLWLADSSGFLYRSAGKLYHYVLAAETVHFLVSSDLFSDYRNLNGVWILP